MSLDAVCTTTTTRSRHTSQACPCLRHLFCAFMLAAARAANETGAARRLQRRLGQWLRHERLSVAMALAENNHHTAPRRKMTARAGGEARVAPHGQAPEAPLSPKDGFCGTLWDICPCLLLMSLCRRWWISCRMSCSSWQRSCWWFPNRLSKCRRSCSRYSTATLVSRYAAGGTAGGSTDDRILLFVISADCGAAR